MQVPLEVCNHTTKVSTRDTRPICKICSKLKQKQKNEINDVFLVALLKHWISSVYSTRTVVVAWNTGLSGWINYLAWNRSHAPNILPFTIFKNSLTFVFHICKVQVYGAEDPRNILVSRVSFLISAGYSSRTGMLKVAKWNELAILFRPFTIFFKNQVWTDNTFFIVEPNKSHGS